MPEPGGRKGCVVNGALPKARARVGAAPLRTLFTTCAQAWAREHARSDAWRGLGVFAIDGTTLRVPDTADNVEAFQLPKTGRGRSGYPQTRVVALVAARSHLVMAAEMGPFAGKGAGENSLAEPLWAQVPDHSVLLADRNFIAYQCLHRFRTTGLERYWLLRMKKNQKFSAETVLGDGDELGTVSIGRHLRRHDATLPLTMPVRVIQYELDGGSQRLMTSLLDADRWPAEAVIALYHERWEIELAYGELKTHLMERREALRSKSPEGVRQEVWGVLLAYNLIRHRMALVARKLKAQGRAMSFTYSLRLIRAFLIAMAWEGSPANLPRHLETLDRELESGLLPARRPNRRYQRWVKIKMSKYKRNTGRPPSDEATIGATAK